eukprot:jgi/Tetstr1/430188/TSEL_020019.t1
MAGEVSGGGPEGNGGIGVTTKGKGRWRAMVGCAGWLWADDSEGVATAGEGPEAVPLGNTVPRDELKDLVPDAELSLPAFNVVTGSYDPRSLKSTLLEFKTMRYGVKYTSVTWATAVDRFERSLLGDIQRGLAARDAAWHNTEPGQKGPLRDILDMSEYTGMVIGTVAMTPHEMREVAAGYFFLPSPCLAPVVGCQIILPSTEHNPVIVDLYGDALMNLPAPGDAHWRVQHDAIADALRDHCVHDLGIAVRREVDDLFQQAVPLGNTVPRDELKDLVPDAELSLPAFNVVTGSYDPRSLKSTLLEFKTMRYGVKYTSVTWATAVDRFERSLLGDIQRGLAARDAAWHNTEPGQKGPLRDILDMSEYTGMVFGTVGSGQRVAGQPTGSGGAAERPDLLELAQSGRVGAKSVSDEDDYLAVPELLQRAESGYEAVRPVSRVPGLFPLSTDLTNEYLKHDDRRLPAQEEYLWMSCFGAHMAALFVALNELLPYVPAANQDFTPYLARARNHGEAIDKAFRFRLAFLWRLNEVKRVHAPKQPLLLGWRQQLQVADVDEDVAVDAGVAAKEASGLDELGQRTLDLLSSSLTAQTLKSYAGRLTQFAEFCHDSENISPLEATTATVVRYVAWIGERGHIGANSLQPYLSAINTFFELHNLDPIAKDSLHLTSARRGLMLRQRRLETAPLRVPLPADVAHRFVTKAELIVSAPTPEYQHDFRALVASVVNFMFFDGGLTGVSCRVRDVHVDNYNITLQVYREKGRAGRRGRDDLRVLLLPVAEHPRVARLMHHFIDTVRSVPLVTVASAETNFWAVTPSEQSEPWTAATMSDWLSTTVRLVGVAPPAGTSWTSHSLRKGAASAANAIGVPLSRIRYQGGWATNSDVVLDYIDPNVLPSPGARFFFGHIAPLRHFQVQ